MTTQKHYQDASTWHKLVHERIGRRSLLLGLAASGTTTALGAFLQVGHRRSTGGAQPTAVMHAVPAAGNVDSKQSRLVNKTFTIRFYHVKTRSIL
jgi:hypothetical protein